MKGTMSRQLKRFAETFFGVLPSAVYVGTQHPEYINGATISHHAGCYETASPHENP